MSAVTFDKLKSTVETITGRRAVCRGDQLEAFCVVHEADGQRHNSPSAGYSLGTTGEVVAFCHAGCSGIEMLKRLDLRTDADPSGRATERGKTREGWPDPGELALYLDRCHAALLSSDQAAPARGYLRRRGATGELVRRYRLGFATEGDLPAPGFQYLKNRITYAAWPWIVEGRAVPGLEGITYRPDRKAQPAMGSRKRWWRVEEVDVTSPVIAVEGMMDVLAVDRIAGAQGIATFGKGNVNADSLKRLHERGLRDLLISLDADATLDQWTRMLTGCRDAGIRGVPVTGPPDGMDWGELLALDDDAYYPVASEALTVAGVA